MDKHRRPKDSPQRTAEAAADLVFALDIGTRSVIGIVGVQETGGFRLLDTETKEHDSRAMVDGQIEDIDLVARAVGTVREQLEARLGLPLSRVHIAAAGRALRTARASFAMELEENERIGQTAVSRLEEGAIARAQEDIRPALGDDEADSLFCVGYSVMRYTLDGYPISTLMGHRGKNARADIIATFLPRQVVDSLYRVMELNRLAVASLTLEPIAAMNAVIPPELRILNLALVDIGAGTSDIAVCREGSVAAYTMATVAGDEITEALIRAYLVDFQTAESIKLGLSAGNDSVTYEDILGLEHTLGTQEVLDSLRPAADALCKEIAERILEANGAAPAAVFLVGGGSKLPGLAAGISALLSMEESKVAVGGNNYWKRVVTGREVTGPEFVTPVGIALTAGSLAAGGTRIQLNGRELTLPKEAPTVMDALLSGGYDSRQIMGRSGKSVTFELDGERKIIRGGHPTPAEIRLNGAAAGISSPVSAGDEITLIPAVQGTDAAPLVRDIAGPGGSFAVTLNGREVSAGVRILLNEQPAAADAPIGNQDRLAVSRVETVGQLLWDQDIDPRSVSCRVNGRPAEESEPLTEGDSVVAAPLTAEARVPAAPPVQPEETPASEGALHVYLNGRELSLDPKADRTAYLFVDLLNYVDIDPQKPEGDLLLRLNGREASYLDPLQERDAAEIGWTSAAR